MNIKGEFQGIKWLGFDRTRPGRRREFVLKYSLAPGEWRARSAPAEVSSETKFRAWAIAELELIAKNGEQPKRQTGTATVADLVPQWLELRKQNPDVSGATYSDNRSAMRAQILPRWGAVPVHRLESMRKELRAWVRELAPTMSPIHVRKIVGTFRIFLRDAHLEGWIILRANPLDSDEVTTVIPALPVKRDVVTLPVETVQALIDCEHKDTQLRSLIRYVLAVCTGAGHAEISGCRVSSVLTLDGPHPRLEIAQNFSSRGKPRGDAEHGQAELGKTKNEFRKRAIPLNECARAALRDWLDWGWELWVGRTPSPHDPLLPSARGAFSRPDYADILRQDLERAEQPTTDDQGRPYEFRAFRRTFSTALARAKVHREYREQLMGQRSESVNSVHYTAEVPDELFDAVRRLPFTWRKRSAPGETLVADPQNAPDASHAAAEQPAETPSEPHPAESSEASREFVKRKSPVQVRSTAPGFAAEPPSDATKAPPTERDPADSPVLRRAVARASDAALAAYLDTFAREVARAR